MKNPNSDNSKKIKQEIAYNKISTIDGSYKIALSLSSEKEYQKAPRYIVSGRIKGSNFIYHIPNFFNQLSPKPKKSNSETNLFYKESKYKPADCHNSCKYFKQRPTGPLTYDVCYDVCDDIVIVTNHKKGINKVFLFAFKDKPDSNLTKKEKKERSNGKYISTASMCAIYGRFLQTKYRLQTQLTRHDDKVFDDELKGSCDFKNADYIYVLCCNNQPFKKLKEKDNEISGMITYNSKSKYEYGYENCRGQSIIIIKDGDIDLNDLLEISQT